MRDGKLELSNFATALLDVAHNIDKPNHYMSTAAIIANSNLLP